jgi:methionyl aminopeptidase
MTSAVESLEAADSALLVSECSARSDETVRVVDPESGAEIKGPAEIARMRVAGRVVAECHQLIRELAKPGVRTSDIDREVENLVRTRGGVPAFLGYRGFPNSICASVNDEVVHGIPNRRRLCDGDVLSVDVGVCVDGYYGDAARTFGIGNVSVEAGRLVTVAWESLQAGIQAMKPNARLSDVARAIQAHAEGHGYSLVRDFVGHGIGRSMHEDPQVPNFVSEDLLANDIVLRSGLVLAVEPMLNIGTHLVRTKKNGWTVVTCDGALSAHVEETVAVTEAGREVLTRL